MKNVAMLSVLAGSLVAVGALSAAPLTPGNLVVYRLGDGVNPVDSTTQKVFIDEINWSTGALVQSIPMPTAASGAQLPLTNGGNSTTDGLLTVMNNGKKVCIPGLGTTPGTVNASSVDSGTLPRVIGILDVATGAVDTSTGLNNIGGTGSLPQAPRSVTTDGTTAWYAGIRGGIYAKTLYSNGPATQVLVPVSADPTHPSNFSAIKIYGGTLYADTGFNGAVKVGTFGAALPLAATVYNGLNGLNPSSPAVVQFALLDMSPSVAGYDTLYIAQNNGGLYKFCLVSGIWVSRGSVIPNSYTAVSSTEINDRIIGLDARLTGATGGARLFATRSINEDDPAINELIVIVDTSGYNGQMTGTPTVLRTASTNTEYRGVQVLPPLAGCNAADITDGSGTGNPDGLLTGSDVVKFFSSFFGTCTGEYPCNAADITDGSGNGSPDGLLTGSDVVKFFGSFFGVCNP